MFKAPAYVIISCVFIIFIGMVFGYSYFFYPNSHPIDCSIKSRTGKDCPSCGISRSFSAFSHLKMDEGKSYNNNAFRIFVFFLCQLFIRVSIAAYYFFTRKSISNALIKLDVFISISGFLFAFLPLIIHS